ncbi:MAG: LysM peptidoglycan-binding domain-containing protein [Anaerolineae bacterium]|nr:LysM peptidoglycan-binding domain-containing protein [Anaerolineae bacterium]
MKLKRITFGYRVLPLPRFAFVCFVIILLNTAGCGKSTPRATTLATPTQAPVEVTFPPASPTLVPSATLSASTPQPTQPTLSPSPTACVPPVNWILYVVQRGDNLYRLSVNTGTSVAQVKQANCMTEDVIYVGQSLYLPKLPPKPTLSLPATSLPATSPPEGPVCANELCPNPEFAGTFNIEPGGPNQAEYIPCEFVGEPRIELDTTTFILELGQRRYFYVCGDTPVSAYVTREDGQHQQVDLLTAHPNPDLSMGNAQAVIDWVALPFEPTGVHTMTVKRGDESQVDFIFLVQYPKTERIVVIPPVGPPGAVFQVYYVNFDLNTAPTIDVYGEDIPLLMGTHELSQRSTFSILINQPLTGQPGKGWGQGPIVSQTYNAPGAYAVTFDHRRVYGMFWLE